MRSYLTDGRTIIATIFVPKEKVYVGRLIRLKLSYLKISHNVKLCHENLILCQFLPSTQVQPLVEYKSLGRFFPRDNVKY